MKKFQLFLKISRYLALPAAIFIILACFPTPVAADEPKIPCTVLSNMPAGNTGARQIELKCDLVDRGARNDHITILSKSGKISSTAGWPEIADLENAVWIFDYQSDGNTDLIIDFHRAGAALVAEMYDAQADPQRLDYTLRDGQFNFAYQLPPTVRVVAPDGWWQKGDLINFNLDISVDGLLDAAFDMRTKLKNHVKTDGIVDFVIHIGDQNGNGRPEYDWRTVNPPAGEPRAFQRTFLTVNVKDNEAPLVPVFPWPFLGKLTYGYLTASAHSKSQPPIQVQWETGTITAVGEFVSSRGNDAQWFVNSFTEVAPGQMNAPNFESPFAWYDLAEDQDRQPELSIRLGYFWPEEEYFVKGQYTQPINFVRYSWDQNNDGFWDYKVGLLGSNEVTTKVSVANLNMYLVPYDQLPEWVISKPWGVATFVTAEGVKARGEGIYEWDPSPWLTEEYYTGRSDLAFPESKSTVNDRRDLRDIPAGYRGEYQLNLGGKVFLYISAIDHRLHLFNASTGLWKIDQHSEIKYANLDNEPYLDQWKYYVDGKVDRELDFADNFLLYYGNNEIYLKQVSISPAILQTQPPHTHAEWLDLGDKLAAVRTKYRPYDFQAMMAQFSGPSLHIHKATVRDFRPNPNGFRFILDLQPGFGNVELSFLNLKGIKPGSYVVTYDGTFRIEPLTPPDLSLTLQFAGNAGSGVHEPVLINAQAVNTGLEDARNITLVGKARHGSRSIEFTQQQVNLLSQQPIQTTLSWQPETEGNWEIRVQLMDENRTVITERIQTIKVTAGKESSFQTILSASTGNARRLPAFLLLMILAVIAATTARIIASGNAHGAK